MGDYSNFYSLNVSGTIKSSVQGYPIGVSDTLPTASTKLTGVTILYTGADNNSYKKDNLYTCDGTAWNQTMFGDLQEQIDAAEGEIGAHDADIKTLQTDLDTAESNITALQNTVSTKQDAITLTANRAAISDSNGKLAVSAVTSTELGYLDGVTSNVQSQIDKLSSSISAITTFTVSVVTELPSTGTEKTMYFVKSSSSATGNVYDEFIYVNGAWEQIGSTAFSLSIVQGTSGISINGTSLQSATTSQPGLMTSTQVNALSTAQTDIATNASDIDALETAVAGKQATITGAASTVTTANLTASRVAISNGSGKLAASDITVDELNLLDGATEKLSTTATRVGTCETKISTLEEEVKDLQTITNGTITATVSSDTGNLAQTISILSGSTTVASGTADSSTGSVSLSVTAGTYTVTCTTPDGYATVASQTVTVASQGTAAVAFTLNRYPILNITVSDGDGALGTQTVTAAVGSTSKTASVTGTTSGTAQIIMTATGSCTVSTTYPSGAAGASSWTGTIAWNGTYTVALSVTRTVIWGFTLAQGTSAPASRITYPQTMTYGGKTYTNSAYGLTKASGTSVGGWSTQEIVTNIKPQTGTASAGWTDASKTSIPAGSSSADAVVYVQTYWLSLVNNTSTNTLTVCFSTEQLDSTFQDYAGSVSGTRYGHFRLGCYDALNSSSEAYSRAGTPTGSVSLTDWITYAKARGTGYDIMTWYQYDYLTWLLIMMYGSTDLQTAMGAGYVSGSSVQSQTALTTTEFGMYNGGTTGTSGTNHMAVFWLEDFWGNMFQWVGGASTNASRVLCTQTGYSTASNSDMTAQTMPITAFSSNTGGYVSKVQGNTACGAFPAEFSGSGTTYFADYGIVYASYFPYVGGSYSSGDVAGPFYRYFNVSATGAYALLGARLSYRL